LIERRFLDFNNPDSDHDGVIDGIEIRFGNLSAPFLFDNQDNLSYSYETWSDEKDRSENIVALEFEELDEKCLSYEVSNINTWITSLDSLITYVEKENTTLQLDFIVYAVLFDQESPLVSSYFAAKIETLELKTDRVIDSKSGSGEFSFSKIRSQQ